MNSEFNKLIKLRSLLRFTLSILVLILHAFFVGGIAFYRDWFAQPLSEGGTITVGIFVAALVIVLMVSLQWVYIVISEKRLDPLQKNIVEDLH